MSILGKSASTLIKAANGGTIGAIDKLADSVASIDIKKLKDMSREKKKKATDYSNYAKDIRKARRDKNDATQQMRAHVNLYEEMVMVADEICIKVAIENDTATFTPAVVFRTSNEMTKMFGSFKKTFNALSTGIADFNGIKKEYTNVVLRIKTAERDAIKEYKSIQSLEKKIEQLNTSIEALKK